MNKTAAKVSLMGLLFALAMTFSYLESMIVIPGMPPGIRLGLSNLVTMYCVFFLGKAAGYTMAALKSLFVLLTRGAVAGMLSLCGGLLSVTAILLADFLSKKQLHYLSLSVVGAVFHNIGQLIAARFLVNVFLYYYIPVLILAGLLVDRKTIHLDNTLSSRTLSRRAAQRQKRVRDYYTDTQGVPAQRDDLLSVWKDSGKL